MLQHLSIKDFALIHQVSMDFAEGMTVLTGETGAGKSIILDALGLALGGRADSQAIRPGADQAEIAAIFDISQVPGAVLWLADLALTNEDDLKQCIIRRIIQPQGRSRAMINGRPVTTAQLKLLGEYLIQIHGQHQHQSLLKSTEQCRLLDAFGQHDDLLDKVETTFHQWETLYRQREAIQNQTQQGDAHFSFLNYQITECETILDDVCKLDALYQTHDKLTHAQSDLEALDDMLSRLSGSDEGNILSWIAQIEQKLDPITERDALLQNALACLQNAAIQLEETQNDLERYSDQVQIDPESLFDIEQRLQKIHDLARKFKIEPYQLQDYYERICKERDAIENQEQHLIALTKAMDEAKARYQVFAQQLTQARSKAAKTLAKEVTQAIRELAMPGAVFQISLQCHEEDLPRAKGQETIRFEVSANPGHAPQPLNKVASGGEMSRMSLAIQLILAKYLATPCLIFDEVDVGISGKVGAIVGKALQKLGQSTQVLCITHLPQVAALAHQHFQVSKKQTKTQTLTHIEPLTGDARIEAIARMLSGSQITDPAKAQAKQLMELV